MFTGDESGNFLFRALHDVGLANQSVSRRPGDGLKLTGALMSAACRCAPPDNRPLPEELDNCRGYLERELRPPARGHGPRRARRARVRACLKVLARAGFAIARPVPRFAHGAVFRIGAHKLVASYHPSQQNTFTGKLTRAMLRQVLRRAVEGGGEPIRERSDRDLPHPAPLPGGRASGSDRRGSDSRDSLLEEAVEGGAGVFGGVHRLRSGEVERLRGLVEGAGVARRSCRGCARGWAACTRSARTCRNKRTGGTRAGPRRSGRTSSPNGCLPGPCASRRRPGRRRRRPCPGRRRGRAAPRRAEGGARGPAARASRSVSM